MALGRRRSTRSPAPGHVQLPGGRRVTDTLPFDEAGSVSSRRRASGAASARGAESDLAVIETAANRPWDAGSGVDARRRAAAAQRARLAASDPLRDAVLRLIVETGALGEVAAVTERTACCETSVNAVEVAEWCVQGVLGLVDGSGGGKRWREVWNAFLLERGETMENLLKVRVIAARSSYSISTLGNAGVSGSMVSPYTMPANLTGTSKGTREKIGRPLSGSSGTHSSELRSGESDEIGGGTGSSDGDPNCLGTTAEEESFSARVLRLTTISMWTCEEIERSTVGEHPSLTDWHCDAVAAMLSCMADRTEHAIAGITAMYALRRPGTSAAVAAATAARMPRGEAAIVWRKGARSEKVMKQFLRVMEKVGGAAELAKEARNQAEMGAEIDRNVAVEMVLGSYESGTGSQSARHEAARFTLGMLLMMIAALLRTSEDGQANVWLQPVDISVPTPADCQRPWEPHRHCVIASLKGLWPWGDKERAAVSTSDRDALAESLACQDGGAVDSDGMPVIGRIEMQASQLLERKKERHVFLIGTTGAGKSTLGNLLVDKPGAFHVDSTKTGTLYPQSVCTEWGMEKQVIWDTPGLSDAKNRDALFLSELGLVVDRVQHAAAVVLVIRSPARIPHSLVQALEKYIDLFGPQLAKVLYIVVNDSSRIYPPEDVEMYNMTVGEQLFDELGLEMEPGFLLQIPTNHPDIALSPEILKVQRYNFKWLKQAVIGSRPVLTRMGHQTIESLLRLLTTLEPSQQSFYRKQLLQQSARQREGLQLLLSRADVRRAFFSKRGYVLIQTFDLSRTSRMMQVLQGGRDSRVQQRRELRITPDSAQLGTEIANGLQLRKKHYTSRKEVRATTPEDVFSVLNDLGLVLIPLSAPTFYNSPELAYDNGGESFAAARPGDKVSQRTLRAIADILSDTSTSEHVVKLVQKCMDEASC